ncbi:MAG: hypothetical protein AM326_02375 [Candidatus Thorarchaeota archaeon SMTZ-45]|nr:MAG: hypothetical protein AM326_02375 [Candidatus Thorarchaeota archaeon SMTZ-45]
MRATRTLRTWDRFKGDFVDVVVERPLDETMPCKDCRYYKQRNSKCEGVGSWYYRRRIPFPEFVPNASDCEVRLHPDLLSFVQN